MDYEKEPIIFDETPNKNDRSFDSGNTYQKPSNSLYLNQTNGGRSTTNIVYTKKGMRGRSNEKINNSNNMNNNINKKNNYNNINSNYNYINNQNKNYNNGFIIIIIIMIILMEVIIFYKICQIIMGLILIM